jgi:hypothetical protein
VVNLGQMAAIRQPISDFVAGCRRTETVDREFRLRSLPEPLLTVAVVGFAALETPVTDRFATARSAVGTNRHHP